MENIDIVINSPIILAFVGLCCLAYIINIISGKKANQVCFSVYRAPLMLPMTWVRMFTHVIGHLDVNHLIGNITLILLIGPLLEEKYGSSIIVIMVLTALTTGVLHFLLFPKKALLGASGIVFAFIMISSITGVESSSSEITTIPLTFIMIAILYLGKEIYSIFFIKNDISNFTHIIGGIVGAGCGYLLI